MFAAAKFKLYAIGMAIVAALLGVIKLQAAKNKSLKIRAKTAEKAVKFQQDVGKIEGEIEQEFSDLRRESEKDLNDGKIPEHLKNPRR